MHASDVAWGKAALERNEGANIQHSTINTTTVTVFRICHIAKSYSRTTTSSRRG